MLFLSSLMIVTWLAIVIAQPKTLPEEPASQPREVLTLNGFTLVREDYHGRASDVSVQENVLTTEDQTLTMSFASSSGEAMEYGLFEFVQVKLGGIWYTLMDGPPESPASPFNLSQRTDPLLLPPMSEGAEDLSTGAATEHTVDLSALGGLPPGRYRLVERFFWRRLQHEYHVLADFWVISPGDARPPESEASEQARLEDIVFFVESPYEARREITDADKLISLCIENLSGKKYAASSAVMETRKGDRWENVEFMHANLGLISAWTGNRNFLFLDDPLPAGDYRLRLTMSEYNNRDVAIYPEYEFAIIPYKAAPEPGWDASRLVLSRYDAAEQSTGITMTLTNNVLDRKIMELEYILEAESSYSYGEPFGIDVFLDGTWYNVPFAHGDFVMPLYYVDPDTELPNRTRMHNPVFAVGVLPAGQYRLVKAFDLNDPNETESDLPVYLAKEFAIAEFRVAEKLEWLG